MNALNQLEQQHDEYRSWRRHMHAHPETAFEEVQTSDYIASLLERWGVEMHRGLARTGVVATIRGKLGTSARSIGLRADFDALNIIEETNVAYRSQHQGKMHACGHDGHTTMLLAATQYLAQTRNFDGVVQVIFQPAEEGGSGGLVMVQEGLFDKFPCDAVFAMHNWPALPEGVFALREGPSAAAADVFVMKLIGKGGHAAFPHMTIDPVLCGAHIVTALQQIVSRNVDPLDSAVISVTRFQAGTASVNVVPEIVELAGSVRSFRPETRQKLEEKIRQISKSVAEGFGARVEIEWTAGYPSVINSSKETEFARQVATDLVGPDKVIQSAPTMSSDDFAYFLQERPGNYLALGTGKTNHDPGLHTPHFDFNDDVIPLGATYWVRLAERWLAPSA